MSIQVIQVINSPVPSNCFLLFDKEVNNRCIVVDPGSESNEAIERKFYELKVQPEYIILTHEHFDHIWGCDKLINVFNTPIICSRLCFEAIKSAKKNCSLYYNQKGFEIHGDCLCIEDLKQQFLWNNIKITFIHTPGHSDASICIILDNMIFTGDTLIKDEKTVTKLLSGNKQKISETIKLVSQFKGKGYMVYPGHGDAFDLDSYNLNNAL